MRLPFLSILVTSLASLQGCCSLSRLFCGPDRSVWVPQQFDTPRHTAQTLFEALRREDPEVLFLCLAPAYRHRLGIGDSMVARLAFDRFLEQNPYLHVAGYTEVPEPTLLDPDRATVAVDVVGEPIEIDFVRLAGWELRYRRPDGMLDEVSQFLPSFAGRAQVETMGQQERSQVMVAPFEFDHENVPRVPIEAIERVALVRTWLVTDVRTSR